MSTWNAVFTHSSAAGPGAVWSVLCDVAGWGSWNDGIDTITVHGPVKVGTTFAMTPPGEETVTSSVVEFEPPYLITDLTELDGIAVRVEHRVGSEPDGRSVITFAITVTGDIPETDLAEIGTSISADFDHVIAGLVGYAERQTPQEPI